MSAWATRARRMTRRVGFEDDLAAALGSRPALLSKLGLNSGEHGSGVGVKGEAVQRRVQLGARALRTQAGVPRDPAFALAVRPQRARGRRRGRLPLGQEKRVSRPPIRATQVLARVPERTSAMQDAGLPRDVGDGVSVMGRIAAPDVPVSRVPLRVALNV
jgi:hypothetical protein